jgi:hypothetical protein
LQGIILDDQVSPDDLLIHIVSTSSTQDEDTIHLAIAVLLNEFPLVTSPPDGLPLR